MAETSSAICRVQDTSTTSASSLEPPIPKSEKEIKKKLHTEEGFSGVAASVRLQKNFPAKKISILNIILTSFLAAALNDHGVGAIKMLFLPIIDFKIDIFFNEFVPNSPFPNIYLNEGFSIEQLSIGFF